MAWPAAVLPCFISRFLYRPLEALESVRATLEDEWRAEQNAAAETERIVNDAALNLTIAKGWEWDRAHAEASAWLDDPDSYKELLHWSTWSQPVEAKAVPGTAPENRRDDGLEMGR